MERRDGRFGAEFWPPPPQVSAGAVIVIVIVSPLASIMRGFFPGFFPVVSVVSAVVANSNKTFPTLIVRMLPPGMVGLLVAATLAAAMSSIDSIATAGASLFCLDIYKPFIAPQASEQQLVAVGRIVIAVMSRDANSGGPGEPPCPLGLTIS